MSLQQELIKLELGFWRSSTDPDYYGKHMADDGLAVFSFGVMGKQEAIKSTLGEQSISWGHIRLDDVQVKQLSDDVAAIIYCGHAERQGQPYSANTVSVYVQRDGEWKLTLHQQTESAA